MAYIYSSVSVLPRFSGPELPAKAPGSAVEAGGGDPPTTVYTISEKSRAQ
jgi:hypothetical protein